MRRRAIFACTVLAVALVASLTSATAAGGPTGFVTSRPSMLTPVKDDVTVMPLLTVGDTLPGGIRFESIPDGISLRSVPGGRAEVFVNHETSKVPFPFNTAAPSSANGESDFDNSQVTKLVVNASTGGTIKASFAIPSSAGYQRFCSNYLATAAEGFDRDILFTNEESPDYVLRQEDSWPPALNDPAQEENGVVVALDVKKGTYHNIYGMGRHNHEISLPMPGFDDLVVLSGDDTFTSGPLTDPTVVPPTDPATVSVPAQSELYSYIAPDTNSLLADEGDLYAFVSDDEEFDDYYDFVPGSTESISGKFVEVPKNIATGKHTDGSEIMAEDVGYPEPPNDGSWQRDLRTTPLTGIDGPQWVLQYWATQNNVFEFVRVEDIAYDKRPGMENVAYVIDSGRGTAGPSQPGRSTNGRIWRMEFDPNDPTLVTSMRVFVEGDDNPVQTLNEIHQPDNLETTQFGLLITEDPGGSQQFPAGSTLANATTARLWYVPFTGTPEVVARVDQSADNGPTDFDPRPAGNWGAWESSGIVDASAAFGPGAYLIDVQAHTLWVQNAPGKDTYIDAETVNPDFMYKREGGQLLLIRIPGI